MSRPITYILTATLAVAVLSGGAAVAQDRDHDRGARHAHNRDGGPHDGRRGRGPGGGFRQMIELYDQDGSGGLTQAEIDGVRAARLAEFDADGNGSLNLEEYQALWLDAMRERMVDRFQAHDDDGDGAVTAAEFGEDLAVMVQRFDRNEDGVWDRADFAPMRPRGQRDDAADE